MVERGVQSRVRVMVMVLSSPELNSLLRDGKYNAVTLDEWWRRDPSSLFLEFSVMEVPWRVGSCGLDFEGAGGVVERE